MKTIFTLFITLFTFIMSYAQTAGNWPLNASLSGTAGSHLSVSAISLGSSIPANSFNSGSEWYGEGGWTAASTPDVNGYVQFTVTSNSGYYLVLNSIALIQRRSNTGTPQGAGPNSWSLRSSLDSYTTDITTGVMTINYVTYNVTLPAAFQSIPSTVTFRLYGYNTTVNSGGINRFVFDNISIQGLAHAGILAEQSLSVTAKAGDDRQVNVQWNASGFAEGTTYTVQRSANGADFSSIFHSENATQYNDVAPVNISTLYYRVAAALPDGSTYFSPVAIVKQDEKGRTTIKGVTSQGSSVKTFLHLEGAGSYQVSIWSQDGKPLVRQTLSGQTGDVQSDIAFNHPHGVYILTLAQEGRISSRAFVY
jgi:hypothetical protein